MSRFSSTILSIAVAALFLTTAVRADVTQKSETKVEIKGAVGSMMKMFGGNKPVRTVTYLKGNRQRTDTVDKKGKVKSSNIVDLDREVFINIDHKKKKYTEMTFEQWREMLKSGFAGIMNQKRDDSPKSDEEKPNMNLKFSVDVEAPGESKKIAGYNAEKVIVELKIEGEGSAEKEGEEPERVKGGMNVRSTNWVAKSAAGSEEMRAFARKFAEKLGMDPGQGGMAGAVAQLLKSNEQLAAAMKELRTESDKLAGTPMYVHTVFETWGESDKMKDDDNEQQMPKGFGGLLKGFGKKKMSKKKDDGPNVLLETTMKVTSYSTDSLSNDLFVAPANYKRKDVKMDK